MDHLDFLPGNEESMNTQTKDLPDWINSLAVIGGLLFTVTVFLIVLGVIGYILMDALEDRKQKKQAAQEWANHLKVVEEMRSDFTEAI
jgi:hypothetical protein